VEYDYDVSEIDIFKELAEFIKIQNSDKTKNCYLKWISDFMYWCDNEKINYLKINRREIESYMVYSNDKYSSNSVRSKLMSICSFYTFLTYRYPKIIDANRFRKLKLPKIKLSQRIDIITNEDIKALRKELLRIGRNDIICALDLMVKYGFRVGIFEKIKIDRKGYWSSVSKEYDMKGKFSEKEVKIIKESGLLKLKAYNISNIFLEYSNKLFNEGKIRCPFFPHDIRYYYITKNGKDLSMKDFIKFSRRIHKNMNTTISYASI
jgi:hypothetical protein